MPFLVARATRGKEDRIAPGNIPQLGACYRGHMEIGITSLAGGALIYDASRWSAGQAEQALDTLPAHAAELRGRGEVRYLCLTFAEAVLRQYQRGGLVARVSRDWYLWLGTEATRPFREFRLTAALYVQGLPVPCPLAARYLRSGLGYRASLITERIRNADTLADRLRAGRPIDWAAVGQLIARFHRRGLWHADLNAHNVLIDADDRLWLIDFDRGRLRLPAESWMRGNLDRLQRSLIKLGAQALVEGFSTRAWPQLLEAYDRAS